MPTIKSITAKCRHCQAEFPSRGVGFGSTRAFEATKLSGNSEPCPACGEQAVVDKEDMKVILEDGTVYKDFG